MRRSVIKVIVWLVIPGVASLSTFAAFSQPGSVNTTALHTKLSDSTQVVAPSGWGTLIYNAQASPPKWEIWENGVEYDLNKFGKAFSDTRYIKVSGTST